MKKAEHGVSTPPQPRKEPEFCIILPFFTFLAINTWFRATWTSIDQFFNIFETSTFRNFIMTFSSSGSCMLEYASENQWKQPGWSSLRWCTLPRSGVRQQTPMEILTVGRPWTLKNFTLRCSGMPMSRLFCSLMQADHALSFLELNSFLLSAIYEPRYFRSETCSMGMPLIGMTSSN